MAAENLKKLETEGWRLSAEKLEEEFPGFGNLNFKSALEAVKNADLKIIGTAALPDDLAKVNTVKRYDNGFEETKICHEAIRKDE